MRSLTLFVLFSAALLTQTARADGLIYQLPPDGTSVRYDYENKVTVNGQEAMGKGSFTVSSVGKTVVDGAECRWIEFKSISKRSDTGMEFVRITKILIPEEHIGRGKSPIEHVVRGWAKQGDDEPQEFKDAKLLQSGRMIPAWYLAGPAQNGKELDQAESDSKLGKLACVGVTGDHEFQRDNVTTKIHFESRLHEKAPFGVVNVVWKFEHLVNGKETGSGTINLTLADVNHTALSDLPEKN
jgi:hypothetical protein